MSKRVIVIVLFSFLSGLVLAGLPAVASPDAPSVALHLRRATFDPLRLSPAVATDMRGAPRSRLFLVQFSAAPDASTRMALQVAGLRPLLYIPDNAFLVRVVKQTPLSVTSVPGLRWFGPFQVAYKLPVELDSWLSRTDRIMLKLRLLAAPDADRSALTRDLQALGGVVLGSGDGLNGSSLQVRLPAAALQGVLERDDVLWIEQSITPQIHNDKARQILGVTAAREQFGLTGAGQIVAVTDTGLDSQSSPGLSADFAGRLVRGFSREEMNPDCTGASHSTTWSDRQGHGTHVSGTVLGNGALSPAGASFDGIAPEAGLVIQAVSNGGNYLDCLPEDTSYLSKAYNAGARVQNASWGAPTEGYSVTSQEVDSFLWQHKEHLFVVSAGNNGIDTNGDGVIDPDSIGTPGTAKNVLTVGATENNRPPTDGYCSASAIENTCWTAYRYYGPPFAGDFISDNINGIAAFSSRGPADDGRIKPEIVAPGVNIISARSHDPAASYHDIYNTDYAYNSGTSMAAPMISGMAALVRQWLAQQRQVSAPSAALVKALLLNGAADITPGQYGVGMQREIPAAWPNNVEGWGRATMIDSVGLGGDDRIWLREGAGIQTDTVVTSTLDVSAGQLLRLTLAWTDYPGNPLVNKQLVNDLDLEVRTPNGTLLRGNANADLCSDCRDGAGADRRNNVESVEISASEAGSYIVRVRGAVVPNGPQPFALVAVTIPLQKIFLPQVSR